MTDADFIIIGGAVAIIVAVVIFGYLDRLALKKHNEKLINDVHSHVSNVGSTFNAVIKDVKNDVKKAIAAAAPEKTSAPEEKKPA